MKTGLLTVKVVTYLSRFWVWAHLDHNVKALQCSRLKKTEMPGTLIAILKYI